MLGMLVGTVEKSLELGEEELPDEPVEEDDAAETTLLLLKALTISGFPTKALHKRNATTKTNNCFKVFERFNLSPTCFVYSTYGTIKACLCTSYRTRNPHTYKENFHYEYIVNAR
jgi:hypothetical protein